STFALGVINAGMQDLRVIGDGFQDGVPGYHTNGYFVRKDGPIHAVEDLKGKVIATNQRGSAVDMAVRAMLAKHNLQDKRDVTMRWSISWRTICTRCNTCSIRRITPRRSHCWRR